MVIWLGIPGLLLSDLIPRWKNVHRGTRFLVAIVAVWMLLAIYRFAIHLPISLKIAQLENRLEWDGVGGNVAVLFGGWILGLQSALAWLIGIWLFKKWKNTRRPQQNLGGDVAKSAAPQD